MASWVQACNACNQRREDASISGISTAQKMNRFKLFRRTVSDSDGRTVLVTKYVWYIGSGIETMDHLSNADSVYCTRVQMANQDRENLMGQHTWGSSIQ